LQMLEDALWGALQSPAPHLLQPMIVHTQRGGVY
jgi:hypothetical protein